MQRLLWDEAAELDLLRIMDFIGRQRHSIAAAAKLIRALRDKAAAYARQPEMGTLHPELGRQTRSFRVGNYVAFYEPADDGILAALLVYQHGLVRADDLTGVNVALFQVHTVISIGLFVVLVPLKDPQHQQPRGTAAGARD